MRVQWSVFEDGLQSAAVSGALGAARQADAGLLASMDEGEWAGPAFARPIAMMVAGNGAEPQPTLVSSMLAPQAVEAVGFLGRCGCAGCRLEVKHDKGDTADGLSAFSDPRPFADIPGDSSTTATLAIGGSVSDTLEVANDRDWFRITLTAGQAYVFTLDGSGSPALSDPLLVLRNAAGVELATDDDGGPGVNSRLVYTANESGTYFVEARAYSTETGAYTLAAAITAPPTLLDSIDWGTRLSGANPVTVNVFFGSAGTVITDGGDTYTSVNFTAAQRDSGLLALDIISQAVNINFNIVDSAANAQFKLYMAPLGVDGPYGFMQTPGGDGVGVFNSNFTTQFSGGNLGLGGIGLVTFLHEIGHGLGLAHPHDTGGASAVMNGVGSPFNDYGDFDLNQGPFTTMTYNDGWHTAPWGRIASLNFGYGLQGGMMPLDLAVLQQKYGARQGAASGDTIYDLADANVVGTHFKAVWDTGGADTIRYQGTKDAVIDLRAATLAYEAGGGGFISYAHGIYGGVVIANGVTIEAARSGSGNDRLVGNAADNSFEAGAGDDSVNGGDGSDTLQHSTAWWGLSVRLAFNPANTVSLTLIDHAGGQGNDTLSSIERVNANGVARGLAGYQQLDTSNMDGDRFDDVVMRNTTTGQTGFFDFDAAGVERFGNILSSLPSGWLARGSAQLDPGGAAHLFVQDTNTGSVYFVENLPGGPRWNVVTTSVSANWEMIDQGDLTGDGIADVLLRNALDGFMVIADLGIVPGPQPGPPNVIGRERWLNAINVGTTEWRTIGLGDFDRDGVSDIAVQNISNGLTYFANFDTGGIQNGWGYIAGGLGDVWRGQGAADMNGDGFDEMLFHNASTGSLWYVDLSGGAFGGAWGVVYNSFAGLSFAGAGDYDNDGFEDVLVRNNADGSTLYADMNAGVFAGFVNVGNTGTGWVVV